MLEISRRQILKAGGIVAAVPVVTQLAVADSAAKTHDIAKLPRVKQTLVDPPFVPDHDQIAKGGPKIIEVEFVIGESKRVIDDEGTQINTFTYNGSIPGPMIVCHEGDYIELTLINPAENLFEHNIDFHAATGALGGGGLTHVQPGEHATLRFKAIKPGTFVYHCAPGGSMIPYHVVSGMNGAIMVLPRDGLKDRSGNALHYDRAYYIGEQDYYVPRDDNGDFVNFEDHSEALADTLDLMRKLIPSHVVFNGAVGALTGEGALKAKVGETVLLIHAQANRDTRPHLIGGHGDYVWEQGSFADPPSQGLETWFIRGGSAGAMLYTFKQPGAYTYLTHNLIEAIELGAVAHVMVEGDWDHDLMTQVVAPAPIQV